ncbi:hypothetical protein HZA96_00925 [Candidatus Woesearchaeota archaeon]|nr:hypothetical protein [Candidatus Woesearchaeota archaeon]
MFLKKGETLSITNMQSQLKLAFNKVKQEIDDHRQSINENTNEIQTNHEYLNAIDAKVDRLSQKMEEFALLLRQLTQSESLKQIASAQYTLRSQLLHQQLTETEYNLLSLLFNANQNDYMTYAFIAAELEISEQDVVETVNGLLSKGIPVLKKFVTPELIAVYLSPEFKMQRDYAFSQQHFSTLRNQVSLQSFF